MKYVKLLFIVFTASCLLTAQDTSQTFLSLKNTGVAKFQKDHPEYDGRGTIVLILDTGVDMGVDGLTRTSTGEVKVIDVQDFTGQGDVTFFEADVDESDGQLIFENEDQGYKVLGESGKLLQSAADEYYLGVLEEELWMNSGSRAGDVNENGNREDNFHFLVYEAIENGSKFWVVYLDTDADGSIADENPQQTYKDNFDSFYLPNEKGLPKFTLGLNIFPEKKIVSFFFDDGSHGTHCAGISAGNRIGDTDLYGVAPGAYVMGLKLGNNNFAGGATVTESMKKAYLYADKISKERKEPCIINMSFGIGSEIEGQSDIEIFIDELVKNNPYLYIATSNGNEGPGISTSGMPSASHSIFSSGAVLSQEVGNDLYGTTLDKDIILHFSSRGGEASKPDVVSPGACVSTVPNFSRGDRFWGTSMASPYSAGVMSVLLGAMKVEYPDINIPSQLLYKALRESAKPMDGYNYIDQGGGLINVESAYNLLKKYIDDGEIDKFETYTISAFAPNMPNNLGNNLYIRDASYLDGTENFRFRIKRNNFNDQDKFYRIYNLKCNSDWLKLVQKKVHIRNDQSIYVDVNYNPEILEQPGLYNSKIEAFRADRTGAKEFDMFATLVVPYSFTQNNDYTISFEDVKINPGMLKRYYLKIPSMASNLNIKIDSDKREFTSVRYYLHDPDGRQVLYGNLRAENESRIKREYYDDLMPGVYEFVILGQFTSAKESEFDIDFEIDGINVLGHSIINNELKVANYLAETNEYILDGKLLGFEKDYIVNMNGQETYKIPFKLMEGESKKCFDIPLSKEDFNKVTDFALMIYDAKGKAKAIGGHSQKDASITVKRQKDEGIEEYSLVLIPGFANSPSSISIPIKEKTYLNKPEVIDVSFNKKNKLTFFPDIEYKLNCKFNVPDISLPEENSYFGEISFKSTKTDDVQLTKTIKINN